MSPKQIKAIRARLFLTQNQLAVRLGVARNTVVRWENGTRNISRVTEIAIQSLR